MVRTEKLDLERYDFLPNIARNMTGRLSISKDADNER